MPDEDSNKPAHSYIAYPRSLICLSCPDEETSSLAIQTAPNENSFQNAEGGLNLPLAQTSEVRFLTLRLICASLRQFRDSWFPQ